MKKHIPNIITLLNLLSGMIALLFASQNNLEMAAYFVFIGIFLDFFDGMLARWLKAQSTIGLELDSLADMVTSGVVPGVVMFQLLNNISVDWGNLEFLQNLENINYLPFIGLVIPLAAAYRLAKFNVDDRQDHEFLGLPTPAMALLVLSIPLIQKFTLFEWASYMATDQTFLISISLIGSLLMISELPMFALKFKNFSWHKNIMHVVFLLITLLLLILLQIAAIPLIILLYIILSIGMRLFSK